MNRKLFLQQLGVISLGELVLPNMSSAGLAEIFRGTTVKNGPINAAKGNELFTVDYPALLGRANINYARAPRSHHEGLPIGNGQMGTLVWTDPDDSAKIMFQLNRNDTFSQDRTHKHYDEKILSGMNVETTDDVLSLCRLGIQVGKASFLSQFQDTSEGTVSLKYKGVSGQVLVTNFISANEDVMVAKIEDERTSPEAFVFEINMIRPPHEIYGHNRRDYTIKETNGQVLIVQTVSEGSFFMQYAVAIGIRGRKVKVLEKGDDRISLITEALTGSFDFFLTSAATLYDKTDVGKKAEALLSRVKNEGSDKVLEAHRDWWHSFWRKSRTFVQLSSDDGVADYLEARYNLHLYHMASSARGNLPPGYNYGLWFSDKKGNRAWGGQYKFMNDLMYYLPLYAANHMELTDSYLGMYRRMLPDCEIAAKQRWGVERGAYFPETLGPSGPVILSEKAAPMVHEVLMGKRSRASLPKDVIEECLAEATLDWINPKFKSVRGDQFTWISHLLSSGGQLAMQFYWRYELTGDINWLRESAYPMMKSIVDFYQSYAKKETDGYYHISPTNVHESYWGVKDGIVDLAAIRSLTPKVIACSKTLGVDADRREGWASFLKALTPYPEGNHPDVVRLQSPEPGPGPRGESIPLFPAGTFGAGYALSTVGRQNVDPVWVWPVHPFEDISLARGRYSGVKEDKENFEKMLLTYKNVPSTFYGFMWPPYAGRLGLTDEVRKLLPLSLASRQTTPNGLNNSWGHAGSGLVMEAIQTALMQSIDGLIIIAPAWPAEWRANFTLLARGGFFVSARLEKGATRLVQVESTFGKLCRMVNPWFPAPAFLKRKGKQAQALKEEILEFKLEPGESVILIADPDKMPSLPIKISPDPGPVVKTLEVINSKGVRIKSYLGKA